MPTVRSARPDELAQVGASLAAAFAGDPLWTWMASPSADWTARAGAWFAAEAAIALAGHGEVLVDDDVRGAAIWSPPGRWKTGARESAALAIPSLRLMRTRIRRGLRCVSYLEAHHPARPHHWYLALLGTDPAHQGAGVGSALITAVTDRCDRDGLPAYLESSKEQNVPYYARHGFEASDPLSPPPDGPPVWPMWREPRG